MTGCKYNRTHNQSSGSVNSNNFAILSEYIGHFCGEKHFSSTPFNGFAHSLDHFRQLVCAYMWMCVNKYAFVCAMLA